MMIDEDLHDALLVIIDFVIDQSQRQPLPKESYKALNRAIDKLIDPNQLAHDLLKTKTPDDKIKKIMQEMGRKGGKKGGMVRAARMTQAQRRASASKAARVRWGKELI